MQPAPGCPRDVFLTRCPPVSLAPAPFPTWGRGGVWGAPSTPTDDSLSFLQQTYMLVTAHMLHMREQPPARVTRQPLRGELCWTRPIAPPPGPTHPVSACGLPGLCY